jgi:hypothetical protein
MDRIQRNFEPLQRPVETWRQNQITDATAKLILYPAFVDGKLEAPRSLLPEVHRLYFEPQYPEFSARTMWSLSNAFTSAFKKLDPRTGPQIHSHLRLPTRPAAGGIIQVDEVLSKFSDLIQQQPCLLVSTSHLASCFP